MNIDVYEYAFTSVCLPSMLYQSNAFSGRSIAQATQIWCMPKALLHDKTNIYVFCPRHNDIVIIKSFHIFPILFLLLFFVCSHFSNQLTGSAQLNWVLTLSHLCFSCIHLFVTILVTIIWQKCILMGPWWVMKICDDIQTPIEYLIWFFSHTHSHMWNTIKWMCSLVFMLDILFPACFHLTFGLVRFI